MQKFHIAILLIFFFFFFGFSSHFELILDFSTLLYAFYYYYYYPFWQVEISVTKLRMIVTHVNNMSITNGPGFIGIRKSGLKEEEMLFLCGI